MEPNSCGSVRSKSLTEPNNCGPVRNKFAVPSTSVWAANCKSAAENSYGCCCRPGYHVAPVAAARKCARCSKSRDFHRTACCCCKSAAEAQKNGCCCSNSSGGCRCSSAPLDAKLTRSRWIANHSPPMADDYPEACLLFAQARLTDDSSHQNPLARDRGRSYCPALPMCAGRCCPHAAAANCYSSWHLGCARNSLRQKEAGFAKARVAVRSCQTCLVNCPNGR